MLARRNFIRGGIATIAALPGKAQEVANSVGTNHPKLKAPANACDCHMHIYDPARFRFASNPNTRPAPTRAAVQQYRMLQNRIGTTRVVIVTPRNYGVDNGATVDAIAQFGARARGVAVLHPTVTDAELKKLHDGGIRGIRFSLGDPAGMFSSTWAVNRSWNSPMYCVAYPRRWSSIIWRLLRWRPASRIRLMGSCAVCSIRAAPG